MVEKFFHNNSDIDSFMQVGDEGVIQCVDARHPLLMLKNNRTVGNSFELSR